jgi:two-component system OmpR family sensor kinase
MTLLRRRVTLRARLVALLVGLFTLAFLLVALATTLALRGFLLDRLDQQLRAAGNRFSVSLEHGNDFDADDDEQFASVAGQAAGTLGARILHGTVTAAAVVGRDSNDPATAPGSAARAVLAKLHADPSPHSVELPDLGSYRVIVSRGEDGDLLVTGLPVDEIDHTIARLVGIEGVVFGAALLLVGVSGAVFVRLALRPLNRVAETAARVADLPLSSGTVSVPERAPEPDPHTEVGTLSLAFNHMLEHVEASLHRRQASEERLRRFIADASHELRTPVAVIRGHAELALRTGGALPTEVSRSLDRIAAETQRMGHLVDDLLLLARLDSGRPLAHEEVDVTRLVLDAVSDAQVAGPDHRWRLELPAEPVTVIGDEHALHQVLANLLANARTHTPPGTVVLVATRQLDDGAAELVVSDNGPGIPPDVLPEIFERFVRADDERGAGTGSSGLGLAIVDAIVRALGGHIDLTSVPGETRIAITLPATPVQRP